MMDYTHSKLFDGIRWNDYPELKGIHEKLWMVFPLGHCHHGTRMETERHLKLFLCNLYLSHYYEKPLAVSRTAASFSGGRYKKLHLKRIPFMKVFRFLKAQGLIECKEGFRTSDPEKYEVGCMTRIWPAGKLRYMFVSLEIFLDVESSEDCIILRDDEREEIPFEETDFTRKLKSELGRINQVLLRHHFFYDISLNNPLKSINNYQYSSYNTMNNDTITNNENIINNTDTILLPEPKVILRRFIPQVRAIFSGGKFATGGRLYAFNRMGGCVCGNWQDMPQIQRKSIRIDNCSVVELDYSSFHISILYALKNVHLDFDPYQAVAPKEMRPIVKKLLLTVLNAKNIGEAVNSMNTQIHRLRMQRELSSRDLKFLDAYFKYRPDWHTLIDDLRKAHPLIQEYFCSGAGLSLQRIDSEIMRHILLELAEQDIPCLPVHDSAIVAEHKERRLKMAMESAFRHVMRVPFSCGIDKK